MPDNNFVRMNVKESNKREFDILAASEQRPVYEIVEDALKLYKSIALTKKKNRTKNVPVADIVAAQ